MFGRNKSEGKIGRIGQTFLPFAIHCPLPESFAVLCQKVLPLLPIKDKFVTQV
jgi:hypothetical protein